MFEMLRFMLNDVSNKLIPLAHCPSNKHGTADTSIHIGKCDAYFSGANIAYKLKRQKKTSKRPTRQELITVTVWERQQTKTDSQSSQILSTMLACNDNAVFQQHTVRLPAAIKVHASSYLFVTVSVPETLELSLLRLMPVLRLA